MQTESLLSFLYRPPGFLTSILPERNTKGSDKDTAIIHLDFIHTDAYQRWIPLKVYLFHEVNTFTISDWLKSLIFSNLFQNTFIAMLFLFLVRFPSPPAPPQRDLIHFCLVKGNKNQEANLIYPEETCYSILVNVLKYMF